MKNRNDNPIVLKLDRIRLVTMFAIVQFLVGNAWSAATVLKIQEEVDTADPREIYAIYTPCEEGPAVEIGGYIAISRTLPLEERIQYLADCAFGEGCLNVEGIEVAGGRKIARVEMAEKEPFNNRGHSFWYQAFQGSFGSIQTGIKLRRTFAQSTFQGDWPDEFRLYTHVWLGSHAQDNGWDLEPGEYATIRRGNWRAEGSYEGLRSPRKLRLPTKLVRTSAERYVGESLAGFEDAVVELRDGALWGWRLECWSAYPASDGHLFWSSFAEVLPHPEEIEFDNSREYLKTGPSGMLKDGLSTGTLVLALFETNCQDSDLWPINRRGRILRIPRDMDFEFVHRQPVKVSLDEFLSNSGSDPK